MKVLSDNAQGCSDLHFHWGLRVRQKVVDTSKSQNFQKNYHFSFYVIGSVPCLSSCPSIIVFVLSVFNSCQKKKKNLHNKLTSEFLALLTTNIISFYPSLTPHSHSQTLELIILWSFVFSIHPPPSPVSCVSSSLSSALYFQQLPQDYFSIISDYTSCAHFSWYSAQILQLTTQHSLEYTFISFPP